MLYVCIIIMYHVNAQGVDERMINVHFRERGGRGERVRERERGNINLMVGGNLFSIRDPNQTSIIGPVDINAINKTLGAVFHSFYRQVGQKPEFQSGGKRRS